MRHQCCCALLRRILLVKTMKWRNGWMTTHDIVCFVLSDNKKKIEIFWAQHNFARPKFMQTATFIHNASVS